MPFKPMLAAKCEDIKTLRYPVLASPKLDGIRALVIDGRLVSRTLKPIPNRYLQAKFSKLPEGTDGELIFGDPTADNAYTDTVTAVMSEDGEPAEVIYHVFDNFKTPGGFKDRYRSLALMKAYSGYPDSVTIVPHAEITCSEDLVTFENLAVERGFEGIMVRSLNGPYKQNRSTVLESFLLKVKRFEDGEAIIFATHERMQNDNVATIDNLGHTKRSSHQENKIGHDDLGAVEVRGLPGKTFIINGKEVDAATVEFKIGTGFDAATRKKLWPVRKLLIGKIVKFKYFPTGSVDAPRFPVWLGFRDPIDL